MGKNQHYVPRFLLRNFAVGGTNEAVVAVADLKARTFYPTAPIRGQCSKNYTYGKDGKLESDLCVLEGKASSLIRRIIELDELPLDAASARLLTYFVAIQHGRTPSHARETSALQNLLLRGVLRTPGAPKVRDPNQYSIECEHPEVLALSIAARCATALMDLSTVLVENDSDVGFCLPDTGVVLHNEWARGVRERGVLGYGCQGLQLLLPISPRYLLVKFDPSIYRQSTRRTPVGCNKADVFRVNRVLIAAAERHVYFDGDAATKKFLSRFDSHQRAPRAEQARSSRFVEVEGKRSYVIHGYTRHASVPLDVRWMPILSKSKQVATQERGRVRPAAEQAVAESRPPVSEKANPAAGRVFRRTEE